MRHKPQQAVSVRFEAQPVPVALKHDAVVARAPQDSRLEVTWRWRRRPAPRQLAPVSVRETKQGHGACGMMDDGVWRSTEESKRRDEKEMHENKFAGSQQTCTVKQAKA